MSKAAVPRSRADKTSKVPPSQTPVVSHEIVPGKFNENDWNLMVDRDGADDFIDEIVDGIISASLGKCFNLHIERQLIPFTVQQAKEAINTIIQWQFLARDDGENVTAEVPGWLQDEEPEPAETDCWAQGSVPREVEPVIITETVEEKPEEPEEIEKTEIEDDVVPAAGEPELDDVVSEPDESAQEAERLAKEKIEQEKAEAEKKKKKKFRPYRGSVRAPPLKLTESLDQTEMSMITAELMASMPQQASLTGPLVQMPASCHSILKVQAGRPPGNKDVQYDDFGNVVAVIKLNPERLPNHRVKVNYQVVDPAVEAAQARLDAMRTGRYQAPKPKRRAPKKDEKNEASVSLKDSESSLWASKNPLPPPMIETMEVASGVTIKENGRLKQGPSRYIRRIDTMGQAQKGLKAVSTQVTTPRLNVSDILDRHTPILRPIHDNSPLPPIMAIPHPPEKAKLST